MDNPISKLIPFIGGQFPNPFNKLLHSITNFELKEDDKLKVELWKAYEFGLKRHEGQKRLSGEPYLNHSSTLIPFPTDFEIFSPFSSKNIS